MKYFFALLLLTLQTFAAGFTESLAFRGQGSSDSLFDGLLAAYSFDEPYTVSGDRTNSLNASTHIMRDKFGNMSAYPTCWFQGGIDDSSGAQTRVLTNITLAPVLGTGSFTFAMWYIQDNCSGYVAQKGYGSSSPDWSLNACAGWNVYGNGGLRSCTVANLFNETSLPKLIIFGWDDANQQCFVFNNGAAKQTGNMSPAGSRQNTTNEISIFWESGAVDELYCWNRVLTQAEADRLWGNGLGLKYPFTADKTAYNTVTIVSNYQWAVNFNGGGQIGASSSNAIAVLADSLVTAGLWTNIYFALGFLPDSLIACESPIKWQHIPFNGFIVPQGQPQRNSTFGNQTPFTLSDLSVNGLTGSGNQVNDTKFLVSTFPGNVQSTLPQTDNSFAVFVYNVVGAGYDMGAQASSRGFYFGASATGGNTKSLNGSTANNIITTATSGAGFYMDSRSSATVHKLYFANASTPWGQVGSTDTTSYNTAFTAAQTSWLTENDGDIGAASPATADTISWGSLHDKGFSSADGQTLFLAVTNFRYNVSALLTVTNTPMIIGNSGTLYATTPRPSTTFQWKKNGTAIGGATQSTYTIGTVALSDFGTYTCDGTIGGFAASSTSGQLATVTTTTVSNWVLCAENVNNAGVTVSSNTIWAVDQFWNGMITDSLDTKMYSVNCFVPDSFIACSTPLLQPSGRAYLWVNNGFLTTDTDINGITARGYYDTLVSDSVDIASVSDISYSQYFYSVVNGSGLQGIITGDSNDGLMLQPNRSGNAQWYDYGPANGGAGNLHAAAPGNGYFCGTRTASNADAFYFANSGSAHAALATGSSATTYAAVGLNVYVYRLNGLALGIAGTSSYVSIGKGLTSTESSNQYNRVQTLRTVLGGGFR